MVNEPSPLVSYVIPNYQGEKLLPACLDSVLAQETETPFEIIVVDDASSDGSADLITRRYPGVKLLVNRSNRGPAAAKNLGAAVARGGYLAFLDNDVELHPGWMEAMLGRLRGDEEGLAACASHIMLKGYPSMLNSTGGMINLLGYAWDRGIFSENTDSYKYNTRVMYACSAAMMVNGDALEKAGGFDERFRYLYEDADLGWRMNVYGYKVAYEPGAIAWHLLSSTMGDKRLRNLYLYHRNRLRSVIKNMETDTLKWIWRELVFYFSHRMFAGMSSGPDANRARPFLYMLRVMGWNLYCLPSTLGSRREIAGQRAVSDYALMSEGVLCAQIGYPLIEKDPRVWENEEKPAGGDRNLQRRIVVGRERRGAIGRGWYEREVDTRGVAFRWTGEKATLYLKGDAKRRSIAMRSIMANPLDLTRISLSVNGRLISTFEVPNQPHLHRIPVPGDLDSGTWEIELWVHNPFKPREALQMEDQRTLGVAVVMVEVR